MLRILVPTPAKRRFAQLQKASCHNDKGLFSQPVKTLPMRLYQQLRINS